MKKIGIIGSTGSIGTQALEVIASYPEEFSVALLTTHRQIDLLEQQIAKFKPETVVVTDEEAAKVMKERMPKGIRFLSGAAGLTQGVVETPYDVLLTSVVGAAGIGPTIGAIRTGRDIALANKETLVAAGDIIMPLAREKNIRILPVDSEHSAIFQCLEGQKRENVKRLLITASGGPHFTKDKEQFSSITVEDCLKHPTWTMGAKITIDSATMFNKGLEVIEAHHLFGMDYDAIDVVVHPQSIVHSMIELQDGAILAQMGLPDMKGPIQYAFTWPHRWPQKGAKPLSWCDIGVLTFAERDDEKFPSLVYAYEAGRKGGTLPCVLNGANETAVYAFLERKISFVEIFSYVRAAMDAHVPVYKAELEDIQEADRWARAFVTQCIEKGRY